MGMEPVAVLKPGQLAYYRNLVEEGGRAGSRTVPINVEGLSALLDAVEGKPGVPSAQEGAGRAPDGRCERCGRPTSGAVCDDCLEETEGDRARRVSLGDAVLAVENLGAAFEDSAVVKNDGRVVRGIESKVASQKGWLRSMSF